MSPAGEPPDHIPRGAALVIVFVMLAIIIAGTFYYQYQERQIKDSVTDELSSITLLKAGQIAAWRNERLGDAEVLAQNRMLADQVDTYFSLSDPAGRQTLMLLFNQINTSYRYRNVILIDPDKKVRLSLDPTETEVSLQLNSAIDESFATRTARLTDLISGPGNQSPMMYVIAPLVLDKNGQEPVVGAVLLAIDPGEALYPLVQSWPVPSQTAETLLVKREGDHVLFLNELRHRNNTALNLTIPLSQKDLPAVMAVTGMTGAFEGRDYRGADVISVLGPVPGSSWFMVAKIDTEEAYAAWKTRALFITILVAGVLAGVFILLGLVWQRRQKYYYLSLYAAETSRREVEEQNRMRMETLIRLSAMETATEQELFDFVLDAACRLTASPIAFTGLLSADESDFDLSAWSKSAIQERPVSPLAPHVPVAQAGVWADAVRKRTPVLINDYSAPAGEQNGLKERNVSIRRVISVPIMEENRIVMVSAVANKGTDYHLEDISQLLLLMQGVWVQIRKRRADDALQRKSMDLEAAFEEITATEEELRANYEELAKTQEALKESERKYRNLYTYAQVGLFETSFKNATVVTCNERYAALAGFSSVKEAIGSDILHLYADPEDRIVVGRILREEGYIENHILRLRNHATGEIFWTQFSARFNYEREVAEGSIIDITAQVAAESALRESEEAFRSLAENANDGFLIGNAEGMHVFANRRTAEITGYSIDELVHTSIRQIVRPDEFERVIEERFRKRMAGEPAPSQYETIIVGKDGKDIPIELSSAKIQWYGQPADLIVFRDISKRKMAEEQREVLIRDLEQKNTELERFTYTVSHDLKSPLITIKGFVGLLEDDARSGDPDQLRQDVSRISKAADTMQALLNDVLELSRIGRIVNSPKKVPFGMIVREAMELLEVPLAERGVAVEIAPDFPVVFVDHIRIREVLINLIENAIKFFGNQKTPCIRIGVDTGTAMPVFFVQDNGIGIDPRYLERIFNIFEKLDPAVPGTGIGLSIVRRIIEIHGGKIWAESEGPNKGTTFRFTLPVAENVDEQMD